MGDEDGLSFLPKTSEHFEDKQYVILRLMLNLFNFQSHIMGQNQRMNSFINHNLFLGYGIDIDFNDNL